MIGACFQSYSTRNITAEERRERFLASKAKALAGAPIDIDDSTAWHEVDEPLTSEQRELTSDAVPESDRYSQPSSPTVMNSSLAQRLVKCRYYVQRLLRLFLAHVLLQDNGELQPRHLTGNVYL